MAYEVLARKWRPQQFDDVVGQRHVTETLKNAIESNRVAHAYLFVGPRGVGKTSSARILAKALNCEKGSTTTPCDTCDACKEIMAGNSLDVLEIDGASNTGVDQVRDLRDNVMYAPARGPYKIYIIDEVHMLSIAAFNALLKTLEEPPQHVKFIFATTEPQKVPPTILSRCQRFDLRRISTKDILERLQEVARAEGVEIDNDALLAIARGAEGGLRDAESALDQLIAFRGKKIEEADVLSVFALVARHTLEELAACVLRGDVVSCIQIVAKLDDGGKDLSRLNIELLEYFRNVLIAMQGEAAMATLDLSDEQIAVLIGQATDTDTGRVLRVVDILTEAEGRMRYALSKRTLFETALVRCSRAATVVSIDEVLSQLNELKEKLAAGGSISATPAAGTAPIPAATPKAQPPEPKPQITPKAEPQPVPADEAEPVGSEQDLLASKWADIVEHVGRIAALAKRYLLDAKPVKVQGDLVVIGFDPEFSSSKEKIDVPRNVNAVQKVIGNYLRRDVRVRFEVMDASATLPGDVKMIRETPEGEPVRERNTEGSKHQAKTRQEWLRDPIVRKTLEVFNGDIMDVRE